MIQACTRVLNSKGKLVDCPVNPFQANLYDIKKNLLTDERTVQPFSYHRLQELITIMDYGNKDIEPLEDHQMLIDSIGDPVIQIVFQERFDKFKA